MFTNCFKQFKFYDVTKKNLLNLVYKKPRRRRIFIYNNSSKDCSYDLSLRASLDEGKT